MALLRRAAGYSQHQFAPLTSYGRSTIANVEVGRQRVPRAFWEACDRLLHTNGRLALEYDQVQRLQARVQVAEADALAVSNGLTLAVSPDPSPSQPETSAPDVDPGLPGVLSALTGGRLPVAAASDHFEEPAEAAMRSPEEAADLVLQRFLRLDDEHGGDRLYLPLSRIVSSMATA